MKMALAERQQNVRGISTCLKKVMKPILQPSEYKTSTAYLNKIKQSLDSMKDAGSIDVFTHYVSAMQSSMDKLENLLQERRTSLPPVVYAKLKELRIEVKFFQRRKDSEKNRLYWEDVKLMASTYIPYGDCFADSDFCDLN